MKKGVKEGMKEGVKEGVKRCSASSRPIGRAVTGSARDVRASLGGVVVGYGLGGGTRCCEDCVIRKVCPENVIDNRIVFRVVRPCELRLGLGF